MEGYYCNQGRVLKVKNISVTIKCKSSQKQNIVNANLFLDFSPELVLPLYFFGYVNSLQFYYCF